MRAPFGRTSTSYFTPEPAFFTVPIVANLDASEDVVSTVNPVAAINTANPIANERPRRRRSSCQTITNTGDHR